MSTLVTGVRSGLGRALCQQFEAAALSRKNGETLFAGEEKFDVVIHCAHSRAKDVTTDNLGAYLEDSIDLTDRVLRLCGGVFVLISSISVYPPGHSLREDEPIKLDDVPGFYGVAKLVSEARVRTWAQRSGGRAIVLRLSSMLGPYSPPNVTTRILTGTATSVPLTSGSRFSYVFHHEVGELIAALVGGSDSGIFNVAASDTITLGEVAQMAGRSVEFGSIQYLAPVVGIDKAAAILPALRTSSRERVVRAIADAASSARCAAAGP